LSVGSQMGKVLAYIKQNNIINIRFILIMMAQFQIWDGIMTQVFVNNGLVIEGNKLVASSITNGEFMLIKVISLIISSLILLLLYKYYPRLVFTTATLIVIFYSAVITWNFLVFFHTVL